MIFAKNFARNYEENNTWNIRHLVDESFVPATQWHSVLYWRLSDLWTGGWGYKVVAISKVSSTCCEPAATTSMKSYNLETKNINYVKSKSNSKSFQIWESWYKGSPTYAKLTNAVPYFCGFGLCTRKWGIFPLLGDLLQSH